MTIEKHSGMARELSLVQIGAVVLGNALEFYDFLIFSFFAVPIGQAFFPHTNIDSSLLLTLATFGVGFLTRPAGGIVIGRMGDVYGRKPAMVLSFGLMGIAILGLALTPGFATIGIAAPLLVILFRLLQGFALGGEVGPSSAFLLEAAPRLRRGFYVSLQLASQQVAILVAGLVGLALSAIIGTAALSAWGWRLALLLGAAIVPIGFVMRQGLPETYGASEGGATMSPNAVLRLLPFALLMSGGAVVATYVIAYVSTFASHVLGFAPGLAFGATIVSGACGALCMVAGGVLSDQLGRKPVMLMGMALLLITAPLCFMAMLATRAPWVVFGCAGLMSALLGLLTPPVLLLVSENLPRGLRSGGIGTIYAVALAAFGGTAQFVVAWLSGVTGSMLVPGWYMTACLAVGFCASLSIRETAPNKVG